MWFRVRQKWRFAINRAAEAMTIFAVMMAGLFPLIHMGRLWLGYWVFPLPNQFGSLWVNFNSPLLWDVFAISTYLSVSLIFWYIGLIPDFATIREHQRLVTWAPLLALGYAHHGYANDAEFGQHLLRLRRWCPRCRADAWHHAIEKRPLALSRLHSPPPWQLKSFWRWLLFLG